MKRSNPYLWSIGPQTTCNVYLLVLILVDLGLTKLML